ncbi:integral membrane protein TerC family-domain-containing protein [Tribonema minus]|uniref:Integral membrane protein TerC family-domain-containing protein n=1 Tax=Tribonema minus TaxID=303371 RepID=A0A835YPV1_9STRA|nr:integral membrane protein TerC family-domain-containing protein [Tribonema minus]
MCAPLEEPPDPNRYATALRNTLLSIAGAALFGAGITYVKGTELALEYFAGYIVEQSLSVDNLFVFLLLFEYFSVPVAYQGRVLQWGIIGAVILRGIFVALGQAALESFQPVLLIFAGILLVSSYKLLTEGGDGEEESLHNNKIVQVSKRLLRATEEYDGDRFFTMVDGMRRATPLLLVLVCVEASDLVFAVDSIPAVFGVTKDPLIVYSSNIFAILNLRSLYTVLSTAVGDLVYLRPAVALVLAFVGLKLGAEYFSVTVDTVLSLGIISTILAGGVGLSLYERRNSEGVDAVGDGDPL